MSAVYYNTLYNTMPLIRIQYQKNMLKTCSLENEIKSEALGYFSSYPRQEDRKYLPSLRKCY